VRERHTELRELFEYTLGFNSQLIERRIALVAEPACLERVFGNPVDIPVFRRIAHMIGDRHVVCLGVFEHFVKNRIVHRFAESLARTGLTVHLLDAVKAECADFLHLFEITVGSVAFIKIMAEACTGIELLAGLSLVENILDVESLSVVGIKVLLNIVEVAHKRAALITEIIEDIFIHLHRFINGVRE